ncbi:hypothetical protein GGR56DRAFT_418281 [Xylariaceae sp. FL0804]|nr:hypothetical protein GGR56DRAFT_418281 [Xylariaceae sp. FL0804]
MASIDDGDIAVMDEDMKADRGRDRQTLDRTPLSKVRSLSDGNGAKLSPSPHIIAASRRTSKDDSALVKDRSQDVSVPVTPGRPDFRVRGLSLQMPQRDAASPAPPSSASTLACPPPLSPKLDHAQIYASPTNILPRRSRGLDFSRAATSLHHSTLAEQPSPDSSPTIGGRGMNIPGRGRVNGEYGAEHPSSSLWSMMGGQERMNISSSVGSTNPILSDSSSSSDNDDFMDEEMEDAIVSTPQVVKGSFPGSNAGPWATGGSPSLGSLSSFRTRRRKQHKKKLRGLAGLGFNAAAPPAFSRSPPTTMGKEMRDLPMSHSRRESISWAANQLHISGTENEERLETADASPMTPGRDGAKGVVKRVVTRRSNLLPKTKGFARIRAALAEETTPVDFEARREAEVIRQVRESDMDLEPRTAAPDISNMSTAQCSPNLAAAQDALEEVPEDDMMTDPGLSGGTFKQQVMRNSKGKNFWETFSETSSIAGARVTPPPPAFLPRDSSSGISEDVNMDSPSLSAGSGNNASLFGLGAGLASATAGRAPGGGGSDGQQQRSETPSQQQQQQQQQVTPSQHGGGSGSGHSGHGGGSVPLPPTAAEITRRINNKRRRGDDEYFDPHALKRRAVSPGMSVHNSPVMQSPLQRDGAPSGWGSGSRPGSNHGGDNKLSATPSENGSAAGNSNSNNNNNNSNNGGGSGSRSVNGGKGRVGFQGMVDTNDGLMRMSIE